VKQLHLFPDDKIRIIFSSVGNKLFEFDVAEFHILIFKNKNKYPHLFEEFVFKTNGTFPYCDLLERILMRATISKSLIYWDDSVISFKVGSVEKYKELISEEDFNILLEIGSGLFCQ
jgi:hypothetical protein